MDLKVVALAIILLRHTFLGSAHTIPETNTARLFEPCIDSELYANPTNCGAFYNCAHGVLVEIPCPAELHFNTVAGWCDWPALANCQVSTPALPSTTEIPEPSTNAVIATEVPSTFGPIQPSTTEEPNTTAPIEDPEVMTNPTTAIEESTFEAETTTEVIATDDYFELITNANTNQPPLTTAKPVFRDSCQFEYTTKLETSQSYFDINLLVDNNLNETLNNVTEFKVLVRGQQDAKIILAYQSDRSEIVPEYEIVLGEDKNKRFSINRNGKYVSREKRDTLLSTNAWLPIIVRVHNDGLIELQIEGERNAFLTAKNKNHKIIDYVGFNNDGNPSSDWLFGCPIERQAERFCTQHYFTEINETNFTTFFDIQSIGQNRPYSDIKLTVYVEATRDVAILLSSVDSFSVESSTPSYEIRLAAGDKQKGHSLHRNHESLDDESENNLLQPNVRVPIDIIIETGGSIEVLVSGSKGIKLKEKDSYPVNVRYISFRSNNATLTSRWYFDC